MAFLNKHLCNNQQKTIDVWSDFGDATQNNSEVIEYFLYCLFSVLHFVDGPCALVSQTADHRDQCSCPAGHYGCSSLSTLLW